MKILFFKNESHFHPRISYTCENAKMVNLDYKAVSLKKYTRYMVMLPFMIFCFLSYKSFFSNSVLFILTAFLCLPIHELCHALFCWIKGRKVERICFFPYKYNFSLAGAYVKPAFGVWTITQRLLLYSFPILLLSLIPTLLAFFIPSLRMWMIFISLYNLSISYFDIINILYLLKLPKNCLHFGDFILTVKEVDKPVIIHRLSVTPKLDKIDHCCFQYVNNKLTEINPAPESSEVIKLRQEFINQFNFES